MSEKGEETLREPRSLQPGANSAGAVGTPAGAATGPAAEGNGGTDPQSRVRQRAGEGGLNLKPSGRVSAATAALEAGSGGHTEGQAAVENPVFSCREGSVFYGGKR